jgi:pimeloyl-ACP methyl ester carboxylesterase
MADLADLYPGFASHWIDTAAGRVFARSGGEGPPLLLLHGYPQTNVMWHRVAPALAAHFSLSFPICRVTAGPMRRRRTPRTRPIPSAPWPPP